MDAQATFSHSFTQSVLGPVTELPSGTAAELPGSPAWPAQRLLPQERRDLAVQVLAAAQPVSDLVREHGPGRPRNYSLGLPQIRTCTLNSSGSSRCGIAVLHTTELFRGDTPVRHGVLSVVPTSRPQRGTPFAPRGPEGRSPASTLLWGAATS